MEAFVKGFKFFGHINPIGEPGKASISPRQFFPQPGRTNLWSLRFGAVRDLIDYAYFGPAAKSVLARNPPKFARVSVGRIEGPPTFSPGRP